MFNAYNHWRNTARPVRFFSVDYRAGIFLFIFMMHIRLWTFLLMLTALFVLWFLERRGLTMPLAMRRLRLLFIGSYRPALSRPHHRVMTDRGAT